MIIYIYIYIYIYMFDQLGSIAGWNWRCSNVKCIFILGPTHEKSDVWNPPQIIFVDTSSSFCVWRASMQIGIFLIGIFSRTSMQILAWPHKYLGRRSDYYGRCRFQIAYVVIMTNYNFLFSVYYILKVKVRCY